ncbi:hypothetical protein ACHAXH_007937 [Discostella pseudostelligera]
MMEPHEESALVTVDIESNDIESKPSYVELASDCGIVILSDSTHKAVGVSSTRPYNKIRKFIVPLTLIAAVSGTIVAVSRYEANIKENQALQSTTTAIENLLSVEPRANTNATTIATNTSNSNKKNNNSVVASKGPKDGEGNGSKSSKSDGRAGEAGGTEEFGSMSMLFDAEDIDIALLAAEVNIMKGGESKKGSKGSKSGGGGFGEGTFGEGAGDGGLESFGSISLSMNMMVDIGTNSLDVTKAAKSSKIRKGTGSKGSKVAPDSAGAGGTGAGGTGAGGTGAGGTGAGGTGEEGGDDTTTIVPPTTTGPDEDGGDGTTTIAPPKTSGPGEDGGDDTTTIAPPKTTDPDGGDGTTTIAPPTTANPGEDGGDDTTTKAPPTTGGDGSTTIAPPTTAEPGDDGGEEGFNGDDWFSMSMSMSMAASEQVVDEHATFGMPMDFESEVEMQNGPVFYRRKYIDNHLL